MIHSQLEILEQGKVYLKTVSETDYTEILQPNFISSSGSHMRHIIDHYLAIISGLETNLIDYDVRMRGGQIEQVPSLAIEKIEHISCWLQQLEPSDLIQNIKLSTEVSVKERKIETVGTTLARELVFAGSHAVHHYAMIAQISLAQKINLPPSFGIAPATATFLRQQQCAH